MRNFMADLFGFFQFLPFNFTFLYIFILYWCFSALIDQINDDLYIQSVVLSADTFSLF